MMTRKEAIARLKDHMSVHKIYEERAAKITEAFNMAISALEQPEIIRCKDCCFCNLEYDDDDNQYYSCTARFDESGFWDEVEAEDFCSWAKRRTDG